MYETFSKRQHDLERAGQPDVYQYDSLPQVFRIQVIHIWNSAIGQYSRGDPYDRIVNSQLPIASRCWHAIHDTLAREKGVFSLGDNKYNPYVQCQQYLLSAEVNDVVDLIELTFRIINTVLREYDYLYGDKKPKQDPDSAIHELNHRFREHSIGYQFVENKLIRIDSQYIHAEAMKPAIMLLQDGGFTGASEEFTHAHEHYRNGLYKEAIVEALKAFESTMKTICDQRKWPYDSRVAAKDLIGLLLTKELIPAYLSNHFSGLRSVMEAGLPTVRNKTSGHGQGAMPVDVPEYMAAYTLHLAASNIVFLVEAHKAKK
jgi:hypothetical protein